MYPGRGRGVYRQGRRPDRQVRRRPGAARRSRAGQRQISIHLFGFGADLDRTELLYTSLLVQAAHALAVEQVPYREHPAAYRRSWYAGYAAAIHRRLRAAEARAGEAAEHTRADAPVAGRTVALVLAGRSALVDQAHAAAYPTLGAGRARQLSGSGSRDADPAPVDGLIPHLLDLAAAPTP